MHETCMMPMWQALKLFIFMLSQSQFCGQYCTFSKTKWIFGLWLETKCMFSFQNNEIYLWLTPLSCWAIGTHHFPCLWHLGTSGMPWAWARHTVSRAASQCVSIVTVLTTLTRGTSCEVCALTDTCINTCEGFNLLMQTYTQKDQNIHSWSVQQSTPLIYAQCDICFLHTRTHRCLLAQTLGTHKDFAGVHNRYECHTSFSKNTARTDKLECVGAAGKCATGQACSIHSGSGCICAHCQIPLQQRHTHTGTHYWHSLLTDSGQNMYHPFSAVEGNVSISSKKKNEKRKWWRWGGNEHEKERKKEKGKPKCGQFRI